MEEETEILEVHSQMSTNPFVRAWRRDYTCMEVLPHKDVCIGEYVQLALQWFSPTNAFKQSPKVCMESAFDLKLLVPPLAWSSKCDGAPEMNHPAVKLLRQKEEYNCILTQILRIF